MHDTVGAVAKPATSKVNAVVAAIATCPLVKVAVYVITVPCFARSPIGAPMVIGPTVHVTTDCVPV